jgi:hypothetical protein
VFVAIFNEFGLLAADLPSENISLISEHTTNDSHRKDRLGELEQVF